MICILPEKIWELFLLRTINKSKENKTAKSENTFTVFKTQSNKNS